MVETSPSSRRATTRVTWTRCLPAARRELKRAGAKTIQIVRVPGAYEIPVVVKRLARKTSPPLSAIICLGVILRGETVHAAHIGEAVSRALMPNSVGARNSRHSRSAAFGKRGPGTRALSEPRHNRGAEAAQTAMAMAHVMEKLRG